MCSNVNADRARTVNAGANAVAKADPKAVAARRANKTARDGRAR